MDTAHDFAGAVEALNDGAVGAQRVGLGVDAHAAHGVVRGGLALVSHIVGPFDGLGPARAPELVHVARLGVSVESLNRLCQRIGGHAHLLGQTLQRGVNHVAVEIVVQIVLERLLAQAVHLVGVFAAENVVYQTLGLGDHGLGHLVAAAVLAHEAFAVLVDEAVRGGDIKGGAGLRIAEGQQLNLVHVHQLRANGLRHEDAVAGYAGHVGGGQRGSEVGPLLAFAVLLAQFDIAGKAAGRQDDALVGHQGYGVAVPTGGVHTNHLVAVGNEALAGGVHENLHVFTIGQRIGKGLDVAGAVGGGGAMGARIERAAAQRDEIVEFHAHAFQPFQRGVGAGSKHLDQVQISDLIAAVPGLQGKPVGAVKEGLVGFLIGLKLQADGVLQLGMLFADGLFGQGGLHQRILVAGNFGIVLQLGIGRIVDAAGNDGVAAQEPGLFNHDDGRAFVRCADSRGQSRAAAANDDDVGREGHVLGGGLFKLLAENAFGIASLLEAVLHSGYQHTAGHGCTGDGIHGRCLVVHNRGRNFFEYRVGYAGGFHLVNHLYGGDGAVGHGHFHGHGAMHGSHGRSVGTGRQYTLRLHAHATQDQRERQQANEHFPHETSS